MGAVADEFTPSHSHPGNHDLIGGNFKMKTRLRKSPGCLGCRGLHGVILPSYRYGLGLCYDKPSSGIL